MTSRYPLFVLALLVSVSVFSCKEKDPGPVQTNNPQPEDTSGTWRAEGNRILANNSNAHPHIVTDKEGNPYIIYSDGLAGGKATVVKLQAGKWDVVGVAGFSAGRADNPVLTIDNISSMPVVAYVETSPTAINKVVVMRYNGSEWNEVGATYFQANGVCAPSVSVDNSGNVVVGYTGPPYVGIAKIFDGSQWTSVFTSAPEKRVYKVDVLQGSSWLSYLWDTSLGITHLDVLKSNAGNWDNLKFPTDISPSSFTSAIDQSGTIYLAIEGKSPLRMASVMKYTGAWVYAGDKDFSAGIGAAPFIVVSNDSVNTPYITYRNGNDEATVMLFSQMWANVGKGLAKEKITHSTLAISPVDHKVYVAVNNQADGAINVWGYKR